jgi:hypothetical protein
MDRNKRILLFLLLILGISVTYRIKHPFRQARVSELTYGSGKNARVVTMKIAQKTDANGKAGFSGLAVRHFPDAPKHAGEVKKNLFFIEKEKPSPETIIPAETKKADENPAFIDPLSQVREAINRFTVLGLYETTRDKAVFLQRGKEMVMVRVGDRIDGKYRVTEITNQSIVILAEALNETIRIDMERF